MPVSVVIKSYKISCISANVDRTANIHYLVGSNDNVTWYQVDTQTNVTYVATNTFNMSSNTTAYSYYRLIATKLNNTGSDAYWQFTQLSFYESLNSGGNIYPPALLNSNSTTLYGQSYGNGTYVTSTFTTPVLMDGVDGTSCYNIFGQTSGGPVAHWLLLYTQNMYNPTYTGSVSTSVYM